MHIVDERRIDIAREISLLRKLGASRRTESLQLFRDRQIGQRSAAERTRAIAVKTPWKTAA